MQQGSLGRRRAVCTLLRVLFLATLSIAWPAVEAGVPAVAGRAVIVAGDRQEESIDRALRYVEDRDARIDARDPLEHPDALAWQPAGNRLARGGVTRSRWWIRADFFNADTEPRARVLVITHPTLDDIRYSLHCSDGSRIGAVGGNDHPYSQRPYANRLPAFPLTLPANGQCTAIFAVQADDSFRFPMRLFDEATYERNVQHDYLANGLTLGMQCLLALIALGAALLRRDALLARFSLAIGTQMSMVLVFSATGYSLFWSEQPHLQHSLAAPSLALAWWFTAALCLHLLPGAVTHGATALLLRATAFLAIGMALLQVLWPDPARLSLVVAVIALGLLLLMSITGGAVLVGATNAGLVTAGIAIITLSGLLEAIAWLGMLPANVDFLLIVQAGFIASAMVFAAALLHRGLETRERERSQHDVNRRVVERTRELAGTVARLSSENRQLGHLTTHDSLTGTYNRRFLDNCLQYSADDPATLPLSFILFDIDHFKQVNDRHGHRVGDACLRAVTARVQAQLRNKQDVLCRYGGEEFAVILPKTDSLGAMRVAEKIRDAVAGSPIGCGGGLALEVTISLGVATLTSRESTQVLVESADQALYDAKRNGRNRCEIAHA